MFCWFLTLKPPHVVNRTIAPVNGSSKLGIHLQQSEILPISLEAEMWDLTPQHGHLGRSGQPQRKGRREQATAVLCPGKTFPNDRDSGSSLKRAASMWETRLSIWHSFSVKMYEAKNSKVLPVQSRKWADCWLGFLKEGIQVVDRFIKEGSKSLIVSKMKTEINEMCSHPSYMTFTWKTKDSKYYWECRERELLNAIYQKLMLFKLIMLSWKNSSLKH